MPGLSIAEDQGFKLNLKHAQRRLVEIVLSGTSSLMGRTVRDSNFRQLYGAAIISISRDGSRVPGKVGDIEFQPGDTILSRPRPRLRANKYNGILWQPLQDSAPPDFRRARSRSHPVYDSGCNLEWCRFQRHSSRPADGVTGCITCLRDASMIQHRAGIAIIRIGCSAHGTGARNGRMHCFDGARNSLLCSPRSISRQGSSPADHKNAAVL